MTGRGIRRDLAVLVADLDIENAIRGLLLQAANLNIKPPSFDIDRHFGRDPGCRKHAAEQLRPMLDRYRHALVVFDRDGCGSANSREIIQKEVETQLDANGWRGRAKAIVIAPELEAWIWNDAPQALRAMNWDKSYTELQKFLRSRNLWPKRSPKPPDPKAAMKATLRATGARRSPRVLFQLANEIDPRGCQDPAFNELMRTLREWFPQRS